MKRLQTREGIGYYLFNSLEHRVTHAIITRQGGVSPEPWESLNVGGTVGDDPVRVEENRRRAFQALDRDPETRYDVWQVHGVDVAVARKSRPAKPPYHQADAVITDQPDVTLFMRFADCVPVLLFDPVRQVVGLVHAGWMGTVKAIVISAVQAMQANFGSCPDDLLAGIGPSIGPDHYEVGLDVTNSVRKTFKAQSAALLLERNDHTHLDLWQANRLLLEKAGVHQVEVAGLCTACHVRDFYSHRAEHGRTGRYGALVALR